MLKLEAQKQIKHDEKLTRNKEVFFFFLYMQELPWKKAELLKEAGFTLAFQVYPGLSNSLQLPQFHSYHGVISDCTIFLFFIFFSNEIRQLCCRSAPKTLQHLMGPTCG